MSNYERERQIAAETAKRLKRMEQQRIDAEKEDEARVQQGKKRIPVPTQQEAQVKQKSEQDQRDPLKDKMQADYQRYIKSIQQMGQISMDMSYLAKPHSEPYAKPRPLSKPLQKINNDTEKAPDITEAEKKTTAIHRQPPALPIRPPPLEVQEQSLTKPQPEKSDGEPSETSDKIAVSMLPNDMSSSDELLNSSAIEREILRESRQAQRQVSKHFQQTKANIIDRDGNIVHKQEYVAAHRPVSSKPPPKQATQATGQPMSGRQNQQPLAEQQEQPRLPAQVDATRQAELRREFDARMAAQNNQQIPAQTAKIQPSQASTGADSARKQPTPIQKVDKPQPKETQREISHIQTSVMQRPPKKTHQDIVEHKQEIKKQMAIHAEQSDDELLDAVIPDRTKSVPASVKAAIAPVKPFAKPELKQVQPVVESKKREWHDEVAAKLDQIEKQPGYAVHQQMQKNVSSNKKPIQRSKTPLEKEIAKMTADEQKLENDLLNLDQKLQSNASKAEQSIISERRQYDPNDESLQGDERTRLAEQEIKYQKDVGKKFARDVIAKALIHKKDELEFVNPMRKSGSNPFQQNKKVDSVQSKNLVFQQPKHQDKCSLLESQNEKDKTEKPTTQQLLENQLSPIALQQSPKPALEVNDALIMQLFGKSGPKPEDLEREVQEQPPQRQVPKYNPQLESKPVQNRQIQIFDTRPEVDLQEAVLTARRMIADERDGLYGQLHGGGDDEEDGYDFTGMQ